jgi:uncharacterized membrane protein
MKDDFDKIKRQNKYKLGLFYSNPDDKNLLVPARWGIGRMDFNIAHPLFHRILLFIVILIIVLIIVWELIH